jgi:signal transduction histidine kinase
MNRRDAAHGYRGGHLIGFIIIGVVTLRSLISFQGTPSLLILIPLLFLYTVLYALEPRLSSQFRWYKFFYLPIQTAIVIVLTTLQPFTDITCLLYVPLSIQVLRVFSDKTALAWIMIFIFLLSITLMFGLGWLEGLALILLYIAVCAFVASYDFLYYRTQADQVRSEQLLNDLVSAHRRLQEYAAQAEELAAARERNRLARELHDSASQAIFSIRLTSQSARLLLDREPRRVPEQLDRLQKMTEDALSQLRSLISQLRPKQNF